MFTAAEPTQKGGRGSGNFGHEGNPGHVGGSGKGGWAPAMTRADAAEWSSGSAIKVTMYHGTTGDKATAITDGGFKAGKGSFIGEGIYIGEKSLAQKYGDRVLEIAVNVKRVKTYTNPEEMTKESMPFVQKYNKKHGTKGFANYDAMNAFHAELRQNYDAVHLLKSGPQYGNKEQLSVFNHQNVTVITD